MVHLVANVTKPILQGSYVAAGVYLFVTKITPERLPVRFQNEPRNRFLYFGDWRSYKDLIQGASILCNFELLLPM